MFDLRQAQIITRKIRDQYFSIEQIKWESIYNSIDELLADLKRIHVPMNNEINTITYLYSGYEYIHSFAKQLQNGLTLSDKQITQCKRLALEIKKASAIAECWK